MRDVKIYQIDSDKDIDEIQYVDYDTAMGRTGDVLDSSIYREVFSGDFPKCQTLEDIFKELNTIGSPLVRGHSLSISDVLVVKEGAFYCDRIGFQEIDFDPEQAIKDENLHRVVYVEPGEKPFVTEIGSDLESEQRAVHGMIELIYNDDGTILVGNEEAKLIGMQGNRHLDGGGIIAGPFFVIGDDGEDFRSLDDEEVSKYLEKYAEPEDISEEETQADVGYTIMTW